MVVEDHLVVREGLTTLLNLAKDINVVAQAEHPAEAIEQFRVHLPDVVLTDLRLSGACGSDVISSIRRESKHPRFIVLSAHDGEEDVYRAVQAGARGYLLKGSTTSELIEAIRNVHEGRSYFPSEIAALLAARLSRDTLTSRETDVLRQIVYGRSNRQIALQLEISEATVKVHVNNLFSKLGVNDRTQAATAALLHGIVTLSQAADRRSDI
ncbi:MAG: response regulator transcription factor [Acidobacteria bacterium]|nr:response regulator transcription factor [Acidobacteriota bacterium]